eukprot:1193560-Prorocentrum_minimum.AAC.2
MMTGLNQCGGGPPVDLDLARVAAGCFVANGADPEAAMLALRANALQPLLHLATGAYDDDACRVGCGALRQLTACAAGASALAKRRCTDVFVRLLQHRDRVVRRARHVH